MAAKTALSVNRVASAAALMGEPARAAMLLELMGGRALSAGELAKVAGVTPATASAHLARMLDARLLAVERQGRHRYYRLARPEVAAMIESFMQLASTPDPAPRGTVTPGPRDAAMREARTCYDHIAGRLGVAVADRLIDGGVLEFDDGVGFVTAHGRAVLERLGVDAILERDTFSRSRRPLCRSCLDWSERRPHIAGKLGAALLTRWLEQGWIRRAREGRNLNVTPGGRIGLRDSLGLAWDA